MINTRACGSTFPRALGKMRGRIQIDIGFGDAITPQPRHLSFPTLLADFSPPQLLTYPLATVISEKFEAAIDLGEANTRMKDFRDLYVLAVTTPFEGAVITEAVARTFERRDRLGRLPAEGADRHPAELV